MSKSAIEWTDATWNPITGCTKVSAGCKYCYAEREWPRMTKLVPAYAGRDFADVRMHLDRIEQPLHWKRPRKIFVNSMSDLFHESVDQRFISDVFGVMAACPQHTFQILTKRPARALELLGQGCMGRFQDDVEECLAMFSTAPLVWPLPNVWLGVSVEDQETADERIPQLLQTPAAVRWVSVEPLLGPIDLNYAFGVPTGAGKGSCPMHLAGVCPEGLLPLGKQHLHWVVCGGESGPKARPMYPDWARSLRDQCAAAGVPFLFKQWGEWAPASNLPKDTRLPSSHWGWMNNKGGEPHFGFGPFKDEFAHHELMGRVGKKRAGRLLDGVQHNAYPY